MATSIRPFPINSETPIERVVSPVKNFIKLESSSGIILIASVIIAMFWANISTETYNTTWNIIFTISLGDFIISKPVLLWINDFLMAIFFLLVGLEVKREMVVGDLRYLNKAMLPVSAAIGGIAIPAGIYYILNYNNNIFLRGWAIPAATDIAFALGVLYLLGDRVPLAARVFLATLAIIDDISAIIIIAIFYSASINIQYILLAVVIFGILVLLNKLNIRSVTPYLVVGSVLWFAFLKSGLHATLAGVLLAFTIPATSRIDFKEFKDNSSKLISRLDKITVDNNISEDELPQYMGTVSELEQLAHEIEAPLARLEHRLVPLVSFFIIPFFALANAGVVINPLIISNMLSTLSLGIILGLVIGKPLGVIIFSTIALKLGWASLPEELELIHIIGVGFLAGIGFTMSTFIAGLAFVNVGILEIAKLAILVASTISGILGFLLLRRK